MRTGGLQGVVSTGDPVAARVGPVELEANVLRDWSQSRLLTDSG